MQKMFNVEHDCGEGYENLVRSFSDKQYSNGQEYLDVIKQYKEFTVAPIYQGVGSLWNSQYGFWNTIKGTSQTTQEVISSFSAMFDAQIEAENNAATK